ncbi:MAG: 50S ribosomal protein L30 [Abditibacteriaceae bacterium]
MSQENNTSLLKVKLTKSPIGKEKSQKATVVALGLGRHVGAEIELPANDSVRGMLFKVRHLVEVESA